MNWKQALSLGLCSVGEFKKEPVAYLYNGVRLPDINPMWEQENANSTHEKLYATIYYYENAVGETEIEVCFSALPFVYDGTEMSTGFGYYSTDWLMYSDGLWWWGGGYTDYIRNQKINPEDYIWSSYDILNSDGTVYLAATDPIPVYA